MAEIHHVVTPLRQTGNERKGRPVSEAAPENNKQLEFAEAVAFGVGEIGLNEVDPACRGRLLALTEWMRDYDVDATEAVAGLWTLRQALIEVGRLDAAEEPVPLRLQDPDWALRLMAAYVGGLVDRVTRVRLSPEADELSVRRQVLSEAVALIKGSSLALDGGTAC
jgi:hypothetical protein